MPYCPTCHASLSNDNQTCNTCHATVETHETRAPSKIIESNIFGIQDNLESDFFYKLISTIYKSSVNYYELDHTTKQSHALHRITYFACLSAGSCSLSFDRIANKKCDKATVSRSKASYVKLGLFIESRVKTRRGRFDKVSWALNKDHYAAMFQELYLMNELNHLEPEVIDYLFMTLNIDHLLYDSAVDNLPINTEKPIEKPVETELLQTDCNGDATVMQLKKFKKFKNNNTNYSITDNNIDNNVNKNELLIKMIKSKLFIKFAELAMIDLEPEEQLNKFIAMNTKNDLLRIDNMAHAAKLVELWCSQAVIYHEKHSNRFADDGLLFPKEA